jgi:ribosomal protein L12E/L44/L45/RPP1/RPP2
VERATIQFKNLGEKTMKPLLSALLAILFTSSVSVAAIAADSHEDADHAKKEEKHDGEHTEGHEKKDEKKEEEPAKH